uniref:Transmembrane protein n=1 Tax=Salix viminalis TaxID=40686 RepID=A0A6N2LET2_SALVM
MSHNTISLTLSNTLTPFLYLPYKSPRLPILPYRTSPSLVSDRPTSTTTSTTFSLSFFKLGFCGFLIDCCGGGVVVMGFYFVPCWYSSMKGGRFVELTYRDNCKFFPTKSLGVFVDRPLF